MTTFASLNKDTHGNLKVITQRAAQYGDDIMYAMTFALEFRDIQSCYPIFFYKDSETGEFHSAALFGFDHGQNLFLSDSGWDATYLPLLVRRQQFLIGFQPAPELGEGKTKPVASIDMDNPRVSQTEGQAVFSDGEPTDYLKHMMGSLEYIHRGFEHDKGFIAALLEHELLESFTLEISLKDDAKHQLQGFYTISEEKLYKLDGETLAKFNSQGYLQAIYMAVASHSRVRSLVDKRNALPA